MSPFRMVDISEQLIEGANICAEELLRMALQFGVELDVVVVYRPRALADAKVSMVALVAEKPAIGGLLEGAFERFLADQETGIDDYYIDG